MTTDTDPVAGTWYRHLDKGQEFCVIAVDMDSSLIEIQYFDGNVEEIELMDWPQLDVEPIAEPENWAGAFDIEEIDDFGTSITDTTAADWNGTSNRLTDEEFPPPPADDTDDWGEGLPLEEPWDSVV